MIGAIAVLVVVKLYQLDERSTNIKVKSEVDSQEREILEPLMQAKKEELNEEVANGRLLIDEAKKKYNEFLEREIEPKRKEIREEVIAANPSTYDKTVGAVLKSCDQKLKKFNEEWDAFWKPIQDAKVQYEQVKKNYNDPGSGIFGTDRKRSLDSRSTSTSPLSMTAYFVLMQAVGSDLSEEDVLFYTNSSLRTFTDDNHIIGPPTKIDIIKRGTLRFGLDSLPLAILSANSRYFLYVFVPAVDVLWISSDISGFPGQTTWWGSGEVLREVSQFISTDDDGDGLTDLTEFFIGTNLLANDTVCFIGFIVCLQFIVLTNLASPLSVAQRTATAFLTLTSSKPAPTPPTASPWPPVSLPRSRQWDRRPTSAPTATCLAWRDLTQACWSTTSSKA